MIAITSPFKHSLYHMEETARKKSKNNRKNKKKLS